MKRLLLAAAMVAATTLSAHAVDLELIQNLDLSGIYTDNTNNSANFIGSNLSSVTWDGSTAYVAGGFASGTNANVSIARIGDALTATPTYGTPFGSLTVGSTRRITSLVTNASGSQVFASADTGAGSGDALRAFDTTTLAQQWRIGTAPAANDSTRRLYGAAIDPGFNGTGLSTNGVVALNIGSGNRPVFNQSNGAQVSTYGFAGGMTLSGSATTWRDLQFDTDGDVYARQQTSVLFGQRSGDNSFASAPTADISGLTVVNNIDYQNIALATNAPQGKFAFFNYRASTATGQTFANVLRAINIGNSTAGTFTNEAINLSFGSLAAPATGAGAYDFSYASSNNTLAVTDFSNNRFYVFRVAAPVAVVPEAGTLSLLAVGFATLGGIVLRKRKAA